MTLHAWTCIKMKHLHMCIHEDKPLKVTCDVIKRLFFRYNETLYCVQAVPKINFILYVKKAEWNERVSEMERKSERKKKEYVFFWFMVIWFFLVNLYISCASTTSTSKKKLKVVWIIPKSHSQPKINHAIWN